MKRRKERYFLSYFIRIIDCINILSPQVFLFSVSEVSYENQTTLFPQQPISYVLLTPATKKHLKHQTDPLNYNKLSC